MHPVRVGLIVLPLVGAIAAFVARDRHGAYQPRTRVYYVAAEDVDWNYAPLGRDPVMGRPLPAPWGRQTVYHKQHYVGYTDATFTTPIPQTPTQGILGPMIHAVVGDTLKIVFQNRTATPVSIHAHGVRYAPGDEGAAYNPRRGGGDSVTPGGRYTYTWFVRPEAGPLPGEPSSKVWAYHSHVQGDQDIYRGLVGTIVVTDPAHARADGSPDDVDQEIPLLWLVFNENGHGAGGDEEANLKHAINGYFFGNLPGLTMRVSERVRWYTIAFGTEVDLHTAHWHGGVVKLEGRSYVDVVELAPATAKVADMLADNPGTWLLHCHVGDHMMAGMYATYTITRRSGVLTARR
jgi:FtsP/CotA-like multicopper oxidase with cupredoxin domain